MLALFLGRLLCALNPIRFDVAISFWTVFTCISDFYAFLLSTYDKINANKLIRDPTVNTYNAQLLRWRLIQTTFEYSHPKKSQLPQRQHFASE